MLLMSEIPLELEVDKSLSDAQLLFATLVGNFAIDPQIDTNGVQESAFIYFPDPEKNTNEFARVLIATIIDDAVYRITIAGTSFDDDGITVYEAGLIESIAIDFRSGETIHDRKDGQHDTGSDNERIVRFMNNYRMFDYLASLQQYVNNFESA